MKNKLILKKLAAIAVAITTVIAAVAAPMGDSAKVYAAQETVSLTFSSGTVTVNKQVHLYDSLVLNATHTTGRNMTFVQANINYGGTGLNGIQGVATWYTYESTKNFTFTGNANTSGTITIPVVDNDDASFTGTLVINLTVVTDAGEVVGTRPWITSGGSTSTTGAKEEDVNSHHDCDYEWVTVQSATEDCDGVLEERCKICGATRGKDFESAGGVFFNNVINQIRNAKQGATIKIDTNCWTCYNKAVFDELAKRPDVALITDYVYDHVKYEMIISPGAYNNPTNQALTLDPNGYAGFRRIAPLYPTTVRQ